MSHIQNTRTANPTRRGKCEFLCISVHRHWRLFPINWNALARPCYQPSLDTCPKMDFFSFVLNSRQPRDSIPIMHQWIPPLYDKLSRMLAPMPKYLQLCVGIGPIRWRFSAYGAPKTEFCDIIFFLIRNATNYTLCFCRGGLQNFPSVAAPYPLILRHSPVGWFLRQAVERPYNWK